MGSLQVIVRVPPGLKKLHEPHASLNELTREEAAATKAVGVGLADAIQIERLLILFREVDNRRHLRLHAKSQFVRFHTSRKISLMRMTREIGVVQLREQV